MAELFGYELKKKGTKAERELPSPVPKEEDGDAGVVTAGAHYGQYVDISGDNKFQSEKDLIHRYRDTAAQPECDAAVEDITNDAIISDNITPPVKVRLDNVDTSDAIKEAIAKEFKNILGLLKFTTDGHDIFRRWYVDARLPYHVMIDPKNVKAGIKELRYIDPTRLRKVKEVTKSKDPKTGKEVITKTDEHYVYSLGKTNNKEDALKMHPDSVVYVTSGLLNTQRTRIVSYLHKAIRPVNQLRMMEDAVVIYRISRAPERRIFYIDVGNLPKGKAEEYLQGIMNKYRNKMVYDASTGEVRDDRKHMSMLEDFFLPRREGGRGTEISTLPGGSNLGDIDDIKYFQRKVYQALNVPISRLDQSAETAYTLGRAGDINRDEVKFKKFIDKLRVRFSDLFLQTLRIQLITKGIITEQDWASWKNDIIFDFMEDNFYSELKETEMWQNRFEMIQQMDEYVGKYVSNEWVKKNILRQTDEEIKDLQKQMDAEEKAGDNEFGDPDDPRWDNQM